MGLFGMFLRVGFFGCFSQGFRSKNWSWSVYREFLQLSAISFRNMPIETQTTKTKKMYFVHPINRQEVRDDQRILCGIFMVNLSNLYPLSEDVCTLSRSIEETSSSIFCAPTADGRNMLTHEEGSPSWWRKSVMWSCLPFESEYGTFNIQLLPASLCPFIKEQ